MEFDKFQFFLLVSEKSSLKLSNTVLSKKIGLLKVKAISDTVQIHLNDEHTSVPARKFGEYAPNLIGAVAFDSDDQKSLANIANEHFNMIESSVLNIGKDKNWPTSFQLWLQERLVSTASDYSAQAVQLHRSMFSLRQQHSETQVAFSALEEYVSKHSVPNLLPTFVADQTSYYVPQGEVDSGFKVEQILPVKSNSLSAIQLYFFLPAVISKGDIKLTLTRLESDSILGQWTVDFKKLSPEWNTFAIYRADSDVPQTVHLTLEWNPKGATQHAPKLALSFLNVLSDYSIRLPEGYSSLLRTIAFRCVEFLPGVRTPKLVKAFFPDSSPKDLRPWHGKESLFKFARNVPSGLTDERELVVPLDNATRLLVHPKPEGITMALIENVCPVGIGRITAEVMTENADAGDICYAIAIIKAGQAKMKIQRDLTLDKSNFSGWHLVKANQPSEISLLLNKSTQDGDAIALMTTIPAGGSSENAWATYQSIQLHPITDNFDVTQ